jgi:elongation factor G
LERGGGFQFVDAVKGGVIPKQFISPVESGVKEALEIGVLAGYPMVDIKATLYDGSYHEVDSSELAFKMAGSMAVQSGAKKAKPVLLEPIMKLEVVTPEQSLGDLIGDINSMRGHVESVDTQAELYIIRCLVPLAETFGYATRLRSLTQGRATYSMEFYRYQEVSAEVTDQIIEKAVGRRYG